MDKRPHLTAEQVSSLNEKHGWFQYSDAQGHVSRAFAQDAIEMHERIRAAAPELLEALQSLAHSLDETDLIHDDQRKAYAAARAAIAKATGETP
jgi:hypothetical protein